MRIGIKRISILTMIFACISFISLVLITYCFYMDADAVISGRYTIPATIGFAFVFVFYVLVFLLLLLEFRDASGKKEGLAGFMVAWVLSFFTFLVDKVAIDEIADSLQMGWDLETGLIAVSSAVKLVFIVLIFFHLYKILTRGKDTGDTDIVKDDAIFYVAQIIGFVTGLFGLLVVLDQVIIHKEGMIMINSLPTYFMILIPYIMVVVYWLYLKFREKLPGLYDEKQWKDIQKASLLTLILSLLIMGFLSIFAVNFGLFWFPFYLFMVLCIFSLGTLIFFRAS